LNGSKERGLKYLREAAASNGETSVDAKILLALFLRREHQYPEALEIVRGLIPQYPHDVLLPLEEGHLLDSMGNQSEAAAVYRKVWQMGREGHYAGVHYEISAFALGNLLREQKDYPGAAAAYEEVSQVKDADPQILQKADLAAGEMYDLMQKRDLAVKKYEAVLALNAKTPPAETARKRIKEAYRQD
jgi:tetratricopeptide (TPR) repeat protein